METLFQSLLMTDYLITGTSISLIVYSFIKNFLN